MRMVFQSKVRSSTKWQQSSSWGICTSHTTINLAKVAEEAVERFSRAKIM
jgi:predicted metal-dependent hydrolase